MKLLAKIAMVLSFAYYALTMAYVWIGQLLGWHNDIWDLFDFPIQDGSPPLFSMLIGIATVIFALGMLLLAYVGIWRILNGGPQQDFRALSSHMHRLGWGLIGFWAGFNFLAGVVQIFVAIGVQDRGSFDLSYDPLDLDIVFLILGIAILAIAHTLQRAWEAEEENQAFL